jgi:hypothetical protein
MRARRGSRRRKLVAYALAGATLLGALVAGGASSAWADDAAPVAPGSGAYFGSILDWSGDTVADQAERLGEPSAVYEHSASVPFSPSDTTYLSGFFDQVRQAGSLGVVTLRPAAELSEIDASMAAAVADDLAAAAGAADATMYVRFAPDMNGTWVGWGQQPSLYRTAFRAVADAVHARMPNAVMVWSPAWGGDYPFRPARAADTEQLRELDSDGDGMVGSLDDPYEPYYPGSESVDWVGLSLYHDDTAGGQAVNSVPAPTEFLDSLSSSTAEAGAAFYDRYAVEGGKRMMLETAAYYTPSAGGADELSIKQTWWRQVFEAVSSPAYSQIGVVLWRDTTATRAVAGESVIDWSVTLNSETVDPLIDDLASSELGLGPVTTPTGASGNAAAGVKVGTVWSWVIAGLVLALVAALVVAARRRRPSELGRPSLAYSGPGDRDLRIDLFRGIAIVFVVVNHVGLVSVFQDVTQEAIGVVSGAELFVLLSGVVLGMVYRPKVVSGGIGEVVIRTSRRSWKLYCTALGVVLLVFVLSLIPGVNAGYVTTFTDEGTGALGSSASGRVYDLYGGIDQLLGYPVNPQIIVDILLLRLGPWQFNVMGLYVVLLLVSPLILWALSRRKWLVVLAVSALGYAVGAGLRFRLLPSQFEDSFPLLVWQLLFVVGIVAGFYRREILRWFSTRWGAVLAAAVVILAVCFMLFSWSNPYLSSAVDARLTLLPDNVFRLIYGEFFQRTYLGIGRLVNVVVIVVAVYALLTAYWRPIDRLAGWFFIPLGQATLYVFVMHVFFALIASNIPVLNEGNIWANSLAYVVILASLWFMVKKRFLFSLVPR